MAREIINNGTTPGDGTGESLYSAFEKVNDMTEEIYTKTDVLQGEVDAAETDIGTLQSQVSALSFVSACAVVRRLAAQSIANATITAISFDTETLDNGNCFVIGSPTRLTASVGSGQLLAQISVNVNFAQNATGRRRIFLYMNGNPLLPGPVNLGLSAVPHADSPSFMSATWVVPCVAGDYFEVRVDQTSGGGLDVSSAQAAITISKV